jgi:hypothetical protein
MLMDMNVKRPNKGLELIEEDSYSEDHVSN